MTTALILDVETNGTQPAEVIELFYSVHEDLSCLTLLGNTFEKRYGATVMTAGAMSAHNIMPSEIAGLTAFMPSEVPPCEYLIGHNIDFDWEAIGKPECKRICTLALAREWLPELDSHRLTACMYGILGEKAKGLCVGAHAASVDVSMVAYFLDHFLKRFSSFEELWRLSELARVPKVMPFGKHKGELIATMPSGYRAWLLSQPDVDPFLRKALSR
jgi:exodeoxyribonuclease X